MAKEKQTEKVKEQEIKQEVKSEEKQDKKEIEASKNPSALGKEEKKPAVKKVKKNYALVNGTDLHVSPKECYAICNMIRGRKIDTGIKMVEEVLQYKRVVKMNNREVPHQHGVGVMAGRFPQNASREFLKLLKSLRANAIYHEVEIEKAIISCNANIASKPYKRGGARFKRAHVMIRVDEKNETENTKKNKSNSTKGAANARESGIGENR
jgi:ribosomal protein L22